MSRQEVNIWERGPNEDFEFTVRKRPSQKIVTRMTFNSLVVFLSLFPESAHDDAAGLLQTLYAMEVGHVEDWQQFSFKRIV